MAHHAHGTEIGPHLNRDIINEIFAQIPSPDAHTTARMTEVCRDWWTVGHRYVWGQSFNQLRGLVLHVNNPARRAYFASIVKHIHIQPGDNILSDSQIILSELQFPRLESIYFHPSNIGGMRSANIEALMVPSLRSFTLGLGFSDDEGGSFDWEGNREEDSTTLLNALMICRASLTTLSLCFDEHLPESVEPLLLELLDGTTAVEHLMLDGSSGTLINNTAPEDLLHTLLANKPRLVSLCFPRGAYFNKVEVETFLGRVGPDWSMPSFRVIDPNWESRGFTIHSSEAPTFASSLAAAQLLERLPNLERLSIKLQDLGTPSGEDVKYIFAAISKLEHLRVIELEIFVTDCDVDGEWLVQLGSLKNLESFLLKVYYPQSVSLTDTQLVSFLTDLPNLNQLTLRLEDRLEVACSDECAATIEDILGRMDHFDVSRMTLVTPDPPQDGE